MQKQDYTKILKKGDDDFVAVRDQLLAHVIDDLREADEFLVFTRKNGSDPVCQGSFSLANKRGWIRTLYSQIVDLMSKPDE